MVDRHATNDAAAGARHRVLLGVGAMSAALSSAPVAATAPSPAGDEPAFVAVVEPLPAAVAAEMNGVSWHEGCPVALDDLRLISMNHWGFDGAVHDGELVVHAAVAAPVADVFAGLFAARFPIERMERIDAYGGDDEASMAANNTSAFNCRQIVGGSGPSIHSWGLAIDINTVQNPYLRNGNVLPTAGADYLDRDDVRPGMIVDDDPVVAAFAAIGFDWGGSWNTVLDYQHFEIAEPEEFLGTAAWLHGPVSTRCGTAPVDIAPPEPALAALVDRESGVVDITTLAEWLAGPGAALAAAPCDAAFVLAGVAGSGARRVVVAVDPGATGSVEVTVTLGGLLDDSVEAVRYRFTFVPTGDGSTYSLGAAMWAQRCQPGRAGSSPEGEFTTELCT